MSFSNSEKDEKPDHFRNIVALALSEAAVNGNSNAASVIMYGLLDLSCNNKVDPLQALYNPKEVLQSKKCEIDDRLNSNLFSRSHSFKMVVRRYKDEQKCHKKCNNANCPDLDFDCQVNCELPSLLLWEQFVELVDKIESSDGDLEGVGEVGKQVEKIVRIIGDPDVISSRLSMAPNYANRAKAVFDAFSVMARQINSRNNPPLFPSEHYERLESLGGWDSETGSLFKSLVKNRNELDDGLRDKIRLDTIEWVLFERVVLNYLLSHFHS